jgi:hypothetical protein
MQTTFPKVQVRIGTLLARRSSPRTQTGSPILRRFLAVLLRSLSALAV